MTREQAINYLISSGFSEEQVSEVVRALTYEPTTKNDLGVNCVNRATVLDLINDVYNSDGFKDYSQYEYLFDQVNRMPSVSPQEPCDKCEVGNPCLYCKHEFKAQEREEQEDGMSINNIITGLQSIKAFLDYSMFKGLEEQTKVQWFVLEDAIKVMRKYQKIVGIVSLNDEEFKQCGLKELKEILEVIADGRT